MSGPPRVTYTVTDARPPRSDRPAAKARACARTVLWVLVQVPTALADLVAALMGQPPVSPYAAQAAAAVRARFNGFLQGLPAEGPKGDNLE